MPNEKPAQKLQFTEIADQLQASGTLMDKYLSRETIELLVSKLGLSEEEMELFEGNNDQGHIMRMIGRPGAEKEFALAYCRHNLWTLFSPKDERALEYNIRKVIYSEGLDTQMFWTFAPYLFRAFRKRGIDEDRAMRMILEWGNSGISIANVKREESWGDCHLKGINFVEDSSNGYILDEDPTHVSHQFTEQEAERVVDMILADQEEAR